MSYAATRFQVGRTDDDENGSSSWQGQHLATQRGGFGLSPRVPHHHHDGSNHSFPQPAAFGPQGLPSYNPPAASTHFLPKTSPAVAPSNLATFSGDTSASATPFSFNSFDATTAAKRRGNNGGGGSGGLFTQSKRSFTRGGTMGGYDDGESADLRAWEAQQVAVAKHARNAKLIKYGGITFGVLLLLLLVYVLGQQSATSKASASSGLERSGILNLAGSSASIPDLHQPLLTAAELDASRRQLAEQSVRDAERERSELLELEAAAAAAAQVKPPKVDPSSPEAAKLNPVERAAAVIPEPIVNDPPQADPLATVTNNDETQPSNDTDETPAFLAKLGELQRRAQAGDAEAIAKIKIMEEMGAIKKSGMVPSVEQVAGNDSASPAPVGDAAPAETPAPPATAATPVSEGDAATAQTPPTSDATPAAGDGESFITETNKEKDAAASEGTPEGSGESKPKKKKKKSKKKKKQKKVPSAEDAAAAEKWLQTKGRNLGDTMPWTPDAALAAAASGSDPVPLFGDDVEFIVVTSIAQQPLARRLLKLYSPFISRLRFISDGRDRGLNATAPVNPHTDFTVRSDKEQPWRLYDLFTKLADPSLNPSPPSFYIMMHDQTFVLLDQIKWRLDQYKEAYGHLPTFAGGRKSQQKHGNAFWEEQDELVENTYKGKGIFVVPSYLYGFDHRFVETIAEVANVDTCPPLLNEALALGGLVACAGGELEGSEYDFFVETRNNHREKKLATKDGHVAELSKWREYDAYHTCNTAGMLQEAYDAYYGQLKTSNDKKTTKEEGSGHGEEKGEKSDEKEEESGSSDE